MQKTKKQKYQLSIRRGLITIPNLQPQLVQFIKSLPLNNDNLLNKTFPYIHGLQILRIFTIMEINFIVSSFLEILQKSNKIKVENLKIGIIGGGIMGRLIINTLLIFTKQGLKSENILVSTRQPNHLQFYTENFNIKTFFDNQKVIKQADLIFVATPATLDNWILTDIKKNINARINTSYFNQTTRTSYASTINVQSYQTLLKGQSINTRSDKGLSEADSIPSLKTSKKIIGLVKQEPVSLRPLIYILTSDITQQKCHKILDFPVLVPWIKATDIAKMMEKLRSHFQHQDLNQLKQNPQKVFKQLQICMSNMIFQQQSQQSQQGKQKSQEDENKSISKCKKMDQYFDLFGFSCTKLEKNYQTSQTSGIQIKNQEIQEIQEYSRHKLYIQVLKSQESYSQTFLTKARKWRMAYNNFIA